MKDEIPNDLLDFVKSDSDVAWSWHSVVAVSILDEGGDHEMANRAAARFMSLVFEVDTTKFPEFQEFEKQWNEGRQAREDRKRYEDMAIQQARRRSVL